MLTGKTIKDIMVDTSKYPSISSTSSLKQAMEKVKKSLLEEDKCIRPMISLVFDERRLVGTLRLRDILKGLEPSFLKSSANMECYAGDPAELSIIWDSLFDKESKRLAERPVSEVMSPITGFVGPDDPVVKAAYLMIHNDLLILPVLENKKLVGLVRMLEVFDVLASAVLKDIKNNIYFLRAQA